MDFRASAALCTALVGSALLGGCSHPAAAVADLQPAPAAAASPAAAPAPEPIPTAMGLGELRQPAPAKLSNQPPGLYEVGAFPLRQTLLRPGVAADRQLVDIFCIGCHSTVYIANQPPLARATWEAEVAKMRSAYGAIIPDAEAGRIASYLADAYGKSP